MDYLQKGKGDGSAHVRVEDESLTGRPAGAVSGFVNFPKFISLTV
jgi:hypothetical protein